jgi:hypothetical protein
MVTLAVDDAPTPAVEAELARRRRLFAVLGLLLMAPLMIWIYRPAAHGLDVIGYPLGRDFINVWAGPQLAFGGKLATLFDFHAYRLAISDLFGRPLPFHSWVYPLYALPLFWPLGQLPYFVALALWTFGLFAVFAAVVLRQIAPGHRLSALIILACAPGCLINVVGGQNGFLSAALLIGGILVLDRRPVLAGVLFGLLTFKPHLGLVLPFALIALRAWRTIAAAATTAIILVAISLLMFGVEPWRQYLAATGALETLAFTRFDGFIRFMMISVTASARVFGVPLPVALGLQAAVSLPVLVAACWAVRRTADPCRRAFVLVTAAPLLTPYVFNYDFPMLAAVQVWMLYGRLPWRPEWSVLNLIGWSAPVALMYTAMLGLGLAPAVLVLMFWASVQEAVRAPIPAGVGAAPANALPWPRSAGA